MKRTAGLLSAVLLVWSPARPQEPAVTIRTTAQEVLLDLTVRDSHGKVVKNLGAGDVEIYEDGVKQEVKNFRMVPGREAVQQRVVAERKKKAAKNVAAPAANPLKAVNLVCLVLHNMDTDPLRRKFTMDAVEEFLKTELQPDTWVGVFALDSHLTVLRPFTTNREELLQAVAKGFGGASFELSRVADAVFSAAPNMAYVEVAVSGNPANGGTVTVSQRVVGGELNPRAIGGAEVSTDTGANRQRGDMAGQRRAFGGIAGMQARDQVLWLVDGLAPLPGHKTVLFFSPGMANPGDPNLFQSMVDRANKAYMSLYALDINGLSQNSNAQAGNADLAHAAAVSATQTKISPSGSGAAEMERMRGTDYAVNATRQGDTQATLRELSEGTGGFLIGSTNDLRKPYQRLLEDVDTHYELAYTPSTKQLDGKFRTIEVKLARSGLTAQHRSGYFAMPMDLQPFETTPLGALNLRTAPQAFDLRTSIFEFRSRRVMAFQIPAAKLGATPVAGQQRTKVHVSLLSLVKDANGQVVDKFSQDSPFEIPDANLPVVRASAINYSHAVELAPGHYTVETAAVDMEGRQASATKTQFDVPESKGVALSSIILAQRMEAVNGKVDATDPLQFQAQPTQGQRVVPELFTTLTTDAKPAVYFVVFPDKANAEKPKIQVEILIGGKVLAKQVAELPPPDATGAIPMVVGAVARPGDCELRITATQGGGSAQQSLKYQVVAK